MALLALASLFTAPLARGDEARTDQATPVASVRREDGRRTLRRFPASLLRGTAGVFHGDNLVPFLVGSTATAAGSLFDEDVAGYIADPDHDFGKSLEDGAAPEVDLLDAFLVNWAYTTVLKVAVGRERPNGENAKSFPSGHSSNAFALAAGRLVKRVVGGESS